MGKSMSTAKQVNRGAITKTVTGTAVKTEPNQKYAHKTTPMPSLPNAEYLKKANSMDNAFNNRLKQVFVTSVNDNATLDLPKDRAMPKDRTTPFTLTPHSQTIEERKPNTLLVDDLKVILLNHRENPEKWTFEYIAARYDISKETASKLVENYSTLQTFFGKEPTTVNGSDRYLTTQKEPVKRIEADTHFYEMEEILSGGRKEKKWKTKEQFEKEWKDTPW